MKTVSLSVNGIFYTLPLSHSKTVNSDIRDINFRNLSWRPIGPFRNYAEAKRFFRVDNAVIVMSV